MYVEDRMVHTLSTWQRSKPLYIDTLRMCEASKQI